MRNKQPMIISLSIDPKLSARMNKYVIRKSKPKKTLSVRLTHFQFKYYKSIKKGNRSFVFTYIINDFLDELENVNQIDCVSCSKSELVRIAITYNKMVKKNMLTTGLNGTFIDSKIPIGNKHHPVGKWRDNYNEQDILRHSFVDKIYRKVEKFFSLQEVVVNFEIFYKAYRDNLLDNLLENEQQLRKLLVAMGK